MLGALYRSPALRAAAAFGFAGAAFSGGNLLLARFLNAEDFGLVSLVVGVASVAAPIAPLGLDYVIVRRGLHLDKTMRKSLLTTAVAIGALTGLGSALLYDLRIALVMAIAMATIGMGISQTIAAYFQSERRPNLSVPFLQASNVSLLVVALIAWAFGMKSANWPSALFAASGVGCALAGWAIVAREPAQPAQPVAGDGLWSEALSLMAINVAGSAALQLERLVIPMTVGIADLALFGVAASLVGSPFRMLQMAITFTIVPRLRDAGSAAERFQLLRREFLLFGLVMGPASAVLWLLAPAISHWFLQGRYDLGNALILAMIVSGLLKVLSAFGTSIVSALAPERGLRLLSAASWACIVLAVALSFAFRDFGLVGVIYASSVAWLARTVVAFAIAWPHLRR